jgi:acyl carrier protein
MAVEAAQLAKKTSSRKTVPEKQAAPAQPEFLRLLAETPIDRRRKLLLEFVQKQTSKVLGIATKEVNELTPLNEMGLDSLMAVELRNLLGKALDLQRQLPVTLVFDYPTVTAICEYLAKEVLHLESEARPLHEEAELINSAAAGNTAVLETIEDLSDNDVDRLLSEMNKGKL